MGISLVSKKTDNYAMFTRLSHFTALVITLLLPTVLGAGGDSRSLSFYHTHTGKNLVVTYYQDGEYLPAGMSAINAFLADWRNGQEKNMDPALMDILWDIQMSSRHLETYEVISAYRSPETNSLLRSRSNGVAKNSQHIPGKAIDIRLRGMDTTKLRDTALQLKRGGVGYYAKSDFVHVDTGRVRRW